MEPAVSVRPCLKTHEIQTEVHHESNSSLKVCPVVEDEVDEEIMDNKEAQWMEGEQSSESGTKEDGDTDVGRTGRT